VSPRAEREAAMDDMADYAQRLVALRPAALAGAVATHRNLCAEFTALPTDKLLVEAEAALARLNDAGRPTDYAVIVALMRRVASAPRLQGALWLDLRTPEVSHG